ncbi:hypothetical protein RFI_05953 [Reticulomyxa filosa]|uniref:Uncharacterized protein n=1 Tax=Reticulomyxa filosa TaxID=46433 RepID=X6NXY1_RETFI|nr:hypothetical protein RFI_05953 [Reticulomyxa filosa]|eukprot:ETO31170.1 hypothetical protein RFI_05953 [Reticulomyxa filosa]
MATYHSICSLYQGFALSPEINWYFRGLLEQGIDYETSEPVARVIEAVESLVKIHAMANDDDENAKTEEEEVEEGEEDVGNIERREGDEKLDKVAVEKSETNEQQRGKAEEEEKNEHDDGNDDGIVGDDDDNDDNDNEEEEEEEEDEQRMMEMEEVEEYDEYEEGSSGQDSDTDGPMSELLQEEAENEDEREKMATARMESFLTYKPDELCKQLPGISEDQALETAIDLGLCYLFFLSFFLSCVCMCVCVFFLDVCVNVSNAPTSERGHKLQLELWSIETVKGKKKRTDQEIDTSNNNSKPKKIIVTDTSETESKPPVTQESIPHSGLKSTVSSLEQKQMNETADKLATQEKKTMEFDPTLAPDTSPQVVFFFFFGLSVGE